ncbi:MAG: hypothetical protein JO126_06450 [Alphaproteobacteria bacterium]|nr:hypothetical protein [Alphaproteobacteria bacterium]
MTQTTHAADSLTSNRKSRNWHGSRQGLNPEELEALDKKNTKLDAVEDEEQEKLDRDRQLTDEEKKEEQEPAVVLLELLKDDAPKPGSDTDKEEDDDADNGAPVTGPLGTLGNIAGGAVRAVGGVARSALRVVVPAAVAVGGLVTIEAISNGALLNVTRDRISRGVKYGFGDKDDSCGAIDCSGHTASAVIATMEALNERAREKTGKDVYDIATMRKMLDTGAAYQINNVARQTHQGFVINPRDSKSLQDGMAAIKPGMLLGVERNNVPSWAKGRPFNISHIGVVVKVGNELYVSESASGGVKLTPLKKWLTYSSVRRIYAVNPFAMLKPDSAPVVKAAFNDTPQPMPQAQGLTPIEDA